MVTKWRNRLLLIVSSTLLTIGVIGMYIFITNITDYAEKSYFESTGFQEKQEEFVSLMVLSWMNNLDITEHKSGLTATPEEIEEYRYRDGTLEEQIEGIEERYERRIDNVTSQSVSQQTIDKINVEKTREITDVTNKFTSNEYVSNKLIEKKEEIVDQTARDFANYLSEIVYYFKHNETGEVYTNIPSGISVESYMADETFLYLTDYTIYPNNVAKFAWASAGGEMPSSGWYEGQIAIPRSDSSAGIIQNAYYGYAKEQKAVWKLGLIGIISLILAIAFGRKVAGTGSEKAKLIYDKVPMDVKGLTFVLTIASIAWILLKIVDTLRPVTTGGILPKHLDTVGLSGISVVLVALALIQGRAILRGLAGVGSVKPLIKQSLTNQMIQWIGEQTVRIKGIFSAAFSNRSLGIQVSSILALVFLLGLGVIPLSGNQLMWIVYLICVVIIGFSLLITLAKRIGYFNKISGKITELVSGDVGEDLPVKGEHVLAKVSNELNLLQENLGVLQSEQVKSERLKTELITNVSHDLRTPLTSIITYTDLMKRENLSEKERKKYIDILDRKSKRLKVLIDDLFEISKMESGNVALDLARVDLVQLLQQALGEYDEEVKASSLQFRMSQPDQPIYAQVDGQKLWRVFENIIENIFKYSLENTRVYISIAELVTEGKAVITFKNVSKQELNNEEMELMERFKRGDTSRNTEGSGLGLAIVDSIMQLHHGTLDIEVDGDLFKVVLEMKLDK